MRGGFHAGHLTRQYQFRGAYPYDLMPRYYSLDMLAVAPWDRSEVKSSWPYPNKANPKSFVRYDKTHGSLEAVRFPWAAGLSAECAASAAAFNVNLTHLQELNGKDIPWAIPQTWHFKNGYIGKWYNIAIYCGWGCWKSFRYFGTDLALSSYTTLLKSNMEEGSPLDGEEVLFQVMILRFYMLNFRALSTSKNFKSHWCPPCGQNVTSPEGILPGWLCPIFHILLDFPKQMSAWTHHCIAMPPVFAGTFLQIFSRCHQWRAKTIKWLKWPDGWWLWTWLKMMPGTFAIGEFPPKLTNEVVMLLLGSCWRSPKSPMTWHLRSGWIVVMRVILGPTSP